MIKKKRIKRHICISIIKEHFSYRKFPLFIYFDLVLIIQQANQKNQKRFQAPIFLVVLHRLHCYTNYKTIIISGIDSLRNRAFFFPFLLDSFYFPLSFFFYSFFFPNKYIFFIQKRKIIETNAFCNACLS